jgi:hypothetical protein
VTTTPDEELAGPGIVRLTLLAFKHGRGGHLASVVFEWQEDFRIEAGRGEPGLHNIRLVVEYVMVVDDSVETEILVEALRPMGAETQDIPKTTRQRLMQEARRLAHEEGRLLGHEEGRRLGHEEGRREGRLEVAARALAKGTPPAEVAELTGLTLEEVLELTH